MYYPKEIQMDIKQAILDFCQVSARYLLDREVPEACDKSRNTLKYDVKGRAVRVYYLKRQSDDKRLTEELKNG